MIRGVSIITLGEKIKKIVSKVYKGSIGRKLFFRETRAVL
jgi:hypothetical protein